MAARRLLLLTVLLPLVGAIASLRGLQSTQYSAGGGEDYTIKFVVQLDASRTGEFVVTVRSAKAPLAAERFLEMVRGRFFEGCTFYHVFPGVAAEFGISGNTTMQREWDARGPLRDEPYVATPDWNIRGSIAFVRQGPNSRGTRLLINYDDNPKNDAKGLVTFGRVVSGMSVFRDVYEFYVDRPDVAQLRARGDAYVRAEFPKLSYISYAQQVAFVEEPLHLSKNFTGLLITIAMIVGATLCCVAARQLLPSPAAATGGYKKTKKWEPYEDEAEPLEGKGGSGPGAGAFSIDEDD